MGDMLRPLSKCRVVSRQQWSEIVSARVRGWIAICEASGLSHFDIAAHVGCHRTAISLWKHGKADIYAGSYVALEELAISIGDCRKANGT